eukprot:SAG25_NODE_1491_length_2910_cov_2.543579_3_plen_124_part_00
MAPFQDLSSTHLRAVDPIQKAHQIKHFTSDDVHKHPIQKVLRSVDGQALWPTPLPPRYTYGTRNYTMEGAAATHFIVNMGARNGILLSECELLLIPERYVTYRPTYTHGTHQVTYTTTPHSSY